MLAKAVARYVRMTPRKVGYVIAPLRKRSVADALALLSATNRRAAKPVAKLVASAFANARQRYPELREDDVIHRIMQLERTLALKDENRLLRGMVLGDQKNICVCPSAVWTMKLSSAHCTLA